jgi:acyl-coenzyme A thioesterase 13
MPRWDPERLVKSSVPVEERVRVMLASMIENPRCTGFARIGLEDVEVLSASQETRSVRYAFTVEPSLCNVAGNLHGGAATTLFDNFTTLALLTIARPGYWDGLGVSRTLMVTFLRPLPLGTRVFLDCEVVAAGKGLAHLQGTMRTADGKVCITCIHDRAAVANPKL